MCQKIFRKISQSEQKICLYLSNICKEVSPINFTKMCHPVLELSLNLCNFSKEVSQLTD